MTTHAETAERRGIPAVRHWSRVELALAGLLLAAAVLAWVLTHRLSTPDMRAGILTGGSPMDDSMRSPVLAAGLFLVTWIVMMAAMMLPSVVPFTIGITRLLRAHGTSRAAPIILTLGYFVVWALTGAGALLVLRGFSVLAMNTAPVAARVGAAVLLAAGAYQLTPLKRVCLRHCRSPMLLLMRHGQAALRGRFGAFRAGLGHGGYCLGCCWALMVILLAAGAMSLTWMAIIAAVIALEKLPRHGELVSRVLGVVLVATGLILLVLPAALPAMS